MIHEVDDIEGRFECGARRMATLDSSTIVYPTAACLLSGGNKMLTSTTARCCFLQCMTCGNKNYASTSSKTKTIDH